MLRSRDLPSGLLFSLALHKPGEPITRARMMGSYICGGIDPVEKPIRYKKIVLAGNSRISWVANAAVDTDGRSTSTADLCADRNLLTIGNILLLV